MADGSHLLTIDLLDWSVSGTSGEGASLRLLRHIHQNVSY